MNKILKLFDKKFAVDFLKENVLPLYPDFTDIKRMKIVSHKNNIWEHTYHVVIEFKTTFLSADKKNKILSIFCVAHSEEPRKNVYEGLKFLWEHNFSKGYLTIPRPLFYSEEFRGTFYRGVKGHNLYHYIRKKDFQEIETIVAKTAAWFAKLHKLPVTETENFNKENSRIKTVTPGVDHILAKVQRKYPHYYDLCEKIYKIVIKNEEDFFANSEKRWLVHGDAHPENIIKMGERKIAVIDFADLCLSDFARDIGSFLQQLEYMSDRKINDPEYTEKIKKIFLENYLRNAKIKLDENLRKRIDTYYNWTVLRTATHFLIKEEPETERAKLLLEKIFKNFNLPLSS